MHEEVKKLPKLISLVGSTAAGKTEWSLKLAKKYNGEITNADSRQIYKGMDIGTAKVPGEWKRVGLRRSYVAEGIVHHLIDFLNPGKVFTAAEFRDKAIKYIKLAYKHKKVPMLVGGTGLYVAAVVDNFSIPRVPPNQTLRKSLEEKTHEQLLTLLQTLDEETAAVIDAHNKRRMVRALEVSILSGEKFSDLKKKGEPLFNVLQIGVDVDRGVLHERIERRVDNMVKQGLVKEVEHFVKKKYSWDLSSMRSIGYQEFRGYFEGSYDMDEAIRLLKRNTRRFARRQMTWFRRDKRVRWCKTYEEADALVEEFLRS